MIEKYGLLGAVALIALNTGSQPVGAAQPVSEEDELALGEVTVTAERRETTLQRTPVAVSALSAEDLRARGVADMKDLQFSIPSMSLGDSYGLARITLRGIGNENVLGGNVGGDPGIAFNVDGIVYARPQMASTAFYDLERIEVLRGPQGTLYGRNATGGSVNLVTRKPSDVLQFEASGLLGNRDWVRGEAAVSGPIGTDQVLGRLAIHHEKADGDTRNVLTGGELGDIDNTGVRGTIQLFPTKMFEATLGADYYRNHTNASSYITRGNVRGETTPQEQLGGSFATDDRLVNYNNDGFQRDRHYGAFARLTWHFVSANLTSISAYRKMETNQGFDLDGTDAFYVNTDFRISDSHQTTQELQLTSVAEGRLQWILGAFYFDESAHGAQQFAFPTFGGNFMSGGQVDTTSWAPYGQATYAFTDQARLTLGGRYTHDKKKMTEYFDFFGRVDGAGQRSWSAFTPRASFEYLPTERSMLYASITRGFKSGGFNIGALQPAYEPEHVWSYEIGSKNRMLDDRLELNATAYYYEYTNLQVNQILDVLSILTNAAESEVYGVEIESRARVTRNVKIDFTYGYLDATFKKFLNLEDPFPELGVQDLSGNRLPRSPKHTFAFGAEYDRTLPNGSSIALRADYSYRAKAYFSEFNRDFNAQSAYGLLDARLTFNSAAERYRVSLFVKNATDRLVKNNSLINSGILGFNNNFNLNRARSYGLEFGLRL